MMGGPYIAGSQDFIPGVGIQFLLSRDLRMVVIREIPGVARMTCWSGSSPCRVYIDSSHRDTLRYEWPLVRCYHLIVCLMSLDVDMG
jgi:hypothetical protein